MKRKNLKDNNISEFFLKLLIGILLAFAIMFSALEYQLTREIKEQENKDQCTLPEYEECYYGLTKYQSFRVVSKYGSDKNCVESRVENIDGKFNLFFKTCEIEKGN